MFNYTDLIMKYQNNELTSEEQLELSKWIEASPENKQLFDNLNNPEYLKERLMVLSKVDKEAQWNNVKEKIKFLDSEQEIPKELQEKVRQDAIHYAQENAQVCEDTTHEALVDGYWEGAKDMYQYFMYKDSSTRYFMKVVDETAPDFGTSVGISESRRIELSRQMDGLSKSYANQAIRTCNMFNDILRLCKNISEVVYCVHVHTSWMIQYGIMGYVK